MRIRIALVAACLMLGFARAHAAEPVFRAGAFAIDVTPLELPVLVNGGMTERRVDKIEDRLHARCLVLDDGVNRAAIVIVDSCMMPRSLLDEAKQMASEATKIPTSQMLIAATHTHTAPSVFACLGTDVDEKYAKFLPVQIAKGISEAHARLQPARIGWAVGRHDANVASRRWLMKPGAAPTNPFSGKSDDRAMMHPGPANKSAISITGVIDPDVPVLAVQTLDSKPLAVLTNYSMHYVGAPNISADYFAVVCDKMSAALTGKDSKSPVVALHSNGTSGDQWLMDYTKPRREFDRFTVGAQLAEAALEAHSRVVYYDWVPLVMVEKELEVGVRMPTADEVAKAKKFCETFKDRPVKTVPEVYARETVLLSEMPPTRKLKLQALRLGELGIAAIPNEVFASTGVQIKIESPTPTTFTIELANGCDGYIPPPKQHKLGGYETWRARSSCLEVNAEPKIRAAVLELLNAVSEKRADEKLILAGRTRPLRDALSPSREHFVAVQPAPATVEKKPVGNLSPAEALTHFKLRKGLKIELVASEPLIVDPVAFDWDQKGRMWVVEMHDYPNGLGAAGPADKGPPGGRIKVLEDTDQDGKYDKATVFADKLPFPTGILWLPRGYTGGSLVFVTAAPKILCLEDVNDDLQSDQTHALYSGFTEGNQQLRVNGLQFGMDGLIYCASGGVGRGDPNARIRDERSGELFDLGARDFSFRADVIGKAENPTVVVDRFQPQLGMSQFGRNCDSFGNWFGCNNNTPLFHIVHDDAYLRRNPHLVPEATTVFVPQIPKPGPVYAISEKGIFYHASEVGRFTSANSAMIYRDHILGAEFEGNFFVSEPVHNLVHREIVERKGYTFSSRRAADEQEREFLAADDTWFRPNMIRTGPDGALYISDMYREIIEHPGWIQKDKSAGLTFRNGDDKGRIYRIVPEGKPLRKTWWQTVQNPSAASAAANEAAVGEFAWRGFRSGVTPEELHAPAAAQRAAALWQLSRANALTDDGLRARLTDLDPRVRVNAIKIAETRVNQSTAVGDALLKLVDDPDLGVQFQLAYSLGNWPDRRAAAALAKILATHGQDTFIREAVFSSLTAGHMDPVDEALRKMVSAEHPASTHLALMALRFGNLRLAERLVEGLSGAIFLDRAAAKQLAQLLAGMEREKLTYARLKTELSPAAADKLEEAFRYARQTLAKGEYQASSGTIFKSDGRHSIALLGRGAEREKDIALLAGLLAPQQGPEMQAAAVQQLLDLAAPQTPELLLAGWSSHSPALRSLVLDGLLAREAWTHALLTKLEESKLRPADFDALRRQRLLEHPQPAIQQRAAKVFAGGTSDRREVVTQWQEVLEHDGDAARGAEVFKQRCAVCHAFGKDNAAGVGRSLAGPDLKTLTDRTPKTLLTAILDPNLAVEPRYQSYTLATKDGLVHSGALVEELSTGLRLVDAAGKPHFVPRSEIETFKASGKSLMPEGLEKDISREAMADLLKYLAQ